MILWTSRINKDRGFTLIEVLIALGAMLVGMATMWGLHMSALSVDVRSNNETKALLLAEKMIEQLKSIAVTNFADSALASGNDTPETPYQRSWTVTRVNKWRKHVTVTVSYPENIKSVSAGRIAVTRSVSLTAILVDLSS